MGLPFLFQVVFFIAYSYVLDDAEKPTRSEARQKRLFAHMNWLSNLTALMAWSSEEYATTHNADCLDSYVQADKQLVGELEHVRVLFPTGMQPTIADLNHWSTLLKDQCQRLVVKES